jgi:hypothetical protein
MDLTDLNALKQDSLINEFNTKYTLKNNILFKKQQNFNRFQF